MSRQSLITFTGLDYHSFGYLLEKFSPQYNRYSPYSKNGKIAVLRNAGAIGVRPRFLDPAGCMALVLGYKRTRGSMSMLQMGFGLTNSVLCIFLKFAMRLLFKVLKEEEDAKVKIPSVAEIHAYQDKIVANFPDLEGVWCIMDGLKIPIQKPADEETQNAY
jgi:hypothetical protein